MKITVLKNCRTFLGRETILVLFFCVVLQGCLQTENSNSQDAYLNVSKGQKILVQHCSRCHSYHLLSDQQLIQQGLVRQGDPERSPLYYRMSGSEGPYGPKDMPSGGTISTDDVDEFGAWIATL